MTTNKGRNMDFLVGLALALAGLVMVWTAVSPVFILMGVAVAGFGAWIMLDETISEAKNIARDWPRKEDK